ncbi:MAG TPA: SDR family NAD(P)-dependent oxidoreductase [Methylomirabilota bacterium]|nr:SDR family NAD(P)-dependent oxidoreductase [Methylomirabilota bacterium]
MKRALDVVLSALGLAVLWPAFLVFAALIKAEDGGPVLFRQQRVGRNLKTFFILKFRTMRVDAAESGPAITVRGDDRVTRAGRLLRPLKLDELPQLWNVLVGDMSLVGSRPEVPRYVDLYRAEYTEILKIRPGITDPASIRYRDENQLLDRAEDAERDYVERILPEKLRLSRHYTRNASVGWDIQLVITTLASLFYPARAVEHVVDWLTPFRFWVGFAVQVAALAVANILALLLRFDGHVPSTEQAMFLRVMPLVLVAQVLWMQAFKLFHGAWRYATVRDLRSIAFAITGAQFTWWFAARWLLGVTHYSRGIAAIDALLCVAFLAGVRIARRLHRELKPGGMPLRRVLLVGDEDPMARLVRELVERAGNECEVIGMLNGDPRRKGVRIHGVPVLGTKGELDEVVRRTEPDEILVAMPDASADAREELLRQCRALGRSARLAPDMGRLLFQPEAPKLGGDYNPEDLLFREAIHTDSTVARSIVGQRCVLVTGAGGSIGSEIVRQVAAHGPSRLVLYERHEFALYEIERELRRSFPELVIEPIIGDVADAARVDEVIAAFKPHAIFHAAAYKHVPMMERNPGEALRTNVLGTRTVAEAAMRHDADVFVLISTDKAVEPVCMMGISKRLAELNVQVMQNGSRTKLLTVRFGNVLNSSGSVLPLFREQIERGGPVTVTHPEVTRLFMTVPEAVQLILHTASMGRGGEVFVLDMGKPIRILDMAKALIRLYGLKAGKDIEIRITGLRPGERLFEKLLNDHETVWKSAHPKILRAVSQNDPAMVREEMARLLRVSEERMGGTPGIVRTLNESLPS